MTSRHVVIVTVFFGYEQLTFPAFFQVSYSIHNGGAAEPAIEVRVFFFLVFG